ncbi:unnamed protein product [Cylicostephanus goldi]|uniref:GOST seven transmembrane domain-containing protein n=1 Tax=Cylicostephanus goldi TaxID=71465 RepID=A0A3P6Q9X6_CYLGO|nr:unnamed protein product [Cylicostephanus goldi]
MVNYTDPPGRGSESAKCRDSVGNCPPSTKKRTYQMIGFAQSALNQTQIEIRLSCVEENVDMVFQVEYALRSSPCDKEFFDAKRADNLRKLLTFYFSDPDHIPDTYSYDKIVYYKSKPQNFSCRDSHGSIIFSEADPHAMMVKNVTTLLQFQDRRDKRSNPIVSTSLSSWNPAQTIPADGIYFLVMKIIGVSYPSSSPSEEHNVTITVKWKQPHGFLSAIDYPLLRYFEDSILDRLAFNHLIIHQPHCMHVTGAVIILGMIEKAFFLAEYSTMNTSGRSVEGVLELAELVSCAKRTMSRVLVIIVSVGYGVVKPRLGNTLSQVCWLIQRLLLCIDCS